MGYFLCSERLGFRLWRAEDAALAQALWGDPQVTRYITARGTMSTEEVRTRLADEQSSQARHGLQYWPVFRLADGVHVGCCGLHPYPDERGVLELGFHILPRWWRRGYAAEAARAVIDHAFKTLQAPALFAGHHPENVASRAALTALGFRHTHAELYPPTGRLHPSYRLEAPLGDGHADEPV